MNNFTIIYIIDDDLDDQALLIDAIKEIDSTIECYTAKNGQEGLQKLETDAVPFPTIIFLDINMPRINGRKFLEKIKTHPQFNSIPVIIYTTSDDPKDKEELKHMGAVAYLVKDSDFAMLKKNLLQIFSMVHC